MVGLGVAGRKDKAFSPLCLCPKPLHGPGRDPSRACPLHSPARPCGGQAGHPLPYSRPCPLGQTVGEEISKKDKGQSWAQGTGASHLPSQPCCTGGGGRSGSGDNPGALPEEFNVGPEPRGRTQHLALPAPPTERFPLWQGLRGSRSAHFPPWCSPTFLLCPSLWYLGTKALPQPPSGTCARWQTPSPGWRHPSLCSPRLVSLAHVSPLWAPSRPCMAPGTPPPTPRETCPDSSLDCSPSLPRDTGSLSSPRQVAEGSLPRIPPVLAPLRPC